jgi:hypothetical protein
MNKIDFNGPIQSKKDKILKLINESRNINTCKEQRETNIFAIQDMYLPEYWMAIMQRDYLSKGVSREKIVEMLCYMKSFFIKLKEKEYLNDDNILDVLEQLTYGVSEFNILPRGACFGEWWGRRGCGGLSFDITKSGEFLEHVIYHELVHSITPDLGMIDPTFNQIYSNMNGVIVIKELMAEATACDLTGRYEERAGRR